MTSSRTTVQPHAIRTSKEMQMMVPEGISFFSIFLDFYSSAVAGAKAAQ